MRKDTSCSRSAIVVMLVCGWIVRADSVLTMPEFAEPIKNVTLPVGSDVEFSCDVRHMGTYRVTWSWKNDTEQKFLAIGIVKITRNSRVHISRIQKSDDVTQFNLYVYGIRKEDQGIYYCSVNSNPMIEQIGTLEVSGDKPTEEIVIPNGKTTNGREAIPLLTEDSTNSSSSSSNSSDTNSQNDTNALCIDFGELWESAKQKLSEFLSTIMKFSYSYWFS